jgi:regulator of protease activity HflC (stomatin/prohibitin superfamily)
VKSIITSLLVVILAGCTWAKVPVGSVGVKVDLYGSEKGVQAQQVGPGRYMLSMNQDMYLFPTFTQTRTWTAENHEYITFQSKEGMAVTSSMGITYHVEPDKVSTLFQTYRKGIDEITDLYIHNMVRDAFVEIGSTMPIEDIYGLKKADLVAAVQEKVAKQVAPIGLVVEKVYLIGSMGLPQQVEQGINAKIAATQMAERRQNEVAQAEAEARKEVAKANGEAQAKLALLQVEIQSIKQRGEALAQNPKLIEWEAVQKWDGRLPVTSMGGAVPFVQMPSAQERK